MIEKLADLMRLDDRANRAGTLARGQSRGTAGGGERPQELEEPLVSFESF